MEGELDVGLEQVDMEVYGLIQREKRRQCEGLEMIASENYTSRAVMEAVGSVLVNKYSEGLPGKRYYSGNGVVDEIEILCQKRALDAFGLLGDEWGVNVQPYSGSPANFAVYTGILDPNDRLMGLDLPSGGHLTHGYQTRTKKVSATSKYFQTMGYRVDPNTGLIDYDGLEEMAAIFNPKVIVCGGSGYSREWDYGRLRATADKCGAYLMADIAHLSGLIIAGEAASPFQYCDIVTTTTHKTLRGPRGGMIFYRKRGDLETRINEAVFPGCQGGPHNHTIAGIAVALKQAMSPGFREYCRRIRENCQELVRMMQKQGYVVLTGGSDNHMFLWDVRPLGLTGSKMEKICELAYIYTNKNMIYGDKSGVSPGGVRIGTAALTTRGFGIDEMRKIGEFLDRAAKIAMAIQSEMDGKSLEEFARRAEKSEDVSRLRDDVLELSMKYGVPGLKNKG